LGLAVDGQKNHYSFPRLLLLSLDGQPTTHALSIGTPGSSRNNGGAAAQ